MARCIGMKNWRVLRLALAAAASLCFVLAIGGKKSGGAELAGDTPIASVALQVHSLE